MSNRATITREQYLQQRKDAAKVLRRKIVLPGILFAIPLITLTKLFSKEKPPASPDDRLLFWSLCGIGLVGLIWCYYRMLYADPKLNAIHCPACGKNNGGFKNSRWLIASGKCVQCKEPMLEDTTPSTPERALNAALPSRADYERKYKSMSVLVYKRLLVPLTVILVLACWSAWKHFKAGGNEPADSRLLLTLGLILVVGMLITSNKVKTDGLACPKCQAVQSHAALLKVVLATGNCPSCGAQMLREGGVS